ncbi:patatin [Stylonychia lemnae]|uniref:Patatin n=1 Tax=Stylonychia lemnae TaxID=5949 RepID=A0A078APS1_STYLE|nr:patatin [Stylonychia lemnae]|eukprot:CDW83966.1 patatin [Stylonychia lemnae]
MVEHITRPAKKTERRLDKRYTVLSLDGGGVRGLMTTMILASIEEQISAKIGKTFKITDAVDCIIGTSAGGLIALGLSAGFSAVELRDSVMEEMIPATFSKPRGKVMKWFKPAYDESNLEGQFRKHIHKKLGFKPSDDPTLKNLKAANPRLRTCITAIAYGYDESEGPSFTPRIFDTQNPLDDSKTILQVGRATSAAPTYFAPSKIQDQTNDGTVKEVDFVDGGVFANNPAGWGFALAATTVKAENIRVLSIGTGFRDFSLDQKAEADPSFWEKSKGTLKGWKDSLLQTLQVKDTQGDKKGVASWLSAELLGKSVFDVQKQADQCLELFKDVMGDNYFRLNPGLTQTIKLDRAEEEDRKLMRQEVSRYLKSDEGTKDVEKAITSLLTPDDYYDKALSSLMKAALLFQYCETIDQNSTNEQHYQASALLKLLTKKINDVSPTDDDVEQLHQKIKEDIARTALHYKSDKDYPSIKQQVTQQSE